MRSMNRGQLSLELLMVFLIFITLFFMVVPNINKVKDVGNFAMNFRNAELILDKVYYSCEKINILGPNSDEEIVFYSPTNYSLLNNGSLTISFNSFNETKNISKEIDFSCDVNISIGEGKNKLKIYFDDGLVKVTPNSNSSG